MIYDPLYSSHHAGASGTYDGGRPYRSLSCRNHGDTPRCRETPAGHPDDEEENPIMTTATTTGLLGQYGSYYPTDACSFLVRIVDVRQVFDRRDYLIVPMLGTGRQWVSSVKVRLLDPQSLEEATVRTGSVHP
jgi:hypothetical protein